MTITHPPATVTKERYELYKEFVADEDMPADVRKVAEFYFNKLRTLKDVGEAMAGEWVWQLIIYSSADAMSRMKMSMRGFAFHKQKEWEELERKKKRALNV